MRLARLAINMSGTSNHDSRTLKSRNLAWLVATLILDFLALMLVAFYTTIDELTLTRMTAIRATLTALLPIPALILSSLVSAHFKAVLVFWKINNPLPGSRAFSKYGPADPRIDLSILRRNVGDLPLSEGEQNAKWYRLYKQVDADPAVVDSHKNYLLFRDIAAMSLVLVIMVPPVLYFSGAGSGPPLMSAAWFLGQYLVTVLAARNTGIRFVQNVLAVHASR